MKNGRVLALCAAAMLLTGCSAQKEPPKPPTPFDDYPSNTVISSGSNTIVQEADNVTYRAYFPVEEYGTLPYRFYFSNTVDSTWNYGEFSQGGMEGGGYTITSARIADGGTGPDDPITGYTDITFDGQTSREAAPGETFWSDPVEFTVPEGHYLVWEWTLTGTSIPALSMSNRLYSYSDRGTGDGNFIYAGEIPLPQLVGAKRDVSLKIATLGDSITQGSMTTDYETNYWAAEIYEQLGDGCSLWNLGLGHARASDAALCGDWLERAKSADIVTIAFGTNDILSGVPGTGRGSTAEEIDGWLRTLTTELQNAGCKVILFSAPPFDFEGVAEEIRCDLNTRIPVIAEELGAEYFDFASVLADPANPAHAVYGGHPNDEGSRLAANKFMETYAELLHTED